MFWTCLSTWFLFPHLQSLNYSQICAVLVSVVTSPNLCLLQRFLLMVFIGPQCVFLPECVREKYNKKVRLVRKLAVELCTAVRPVCTVQLVHMHAERKRAEHVLQWCSSLFPGGTRTVQMNGVDIIYCRPTQWRIMSASTQKNDLITVMWVVLIRYLHPCNSELYISPQYYIMCHLCCSHSLSYLFIQSHSSDYSHLPH